MEPENKKSHKIDLNIYSYFFGIIVLAIGILNIFLVHPVPGIVFLLISLIYLPKNVIGLSIPHAVKIALGIIAVWFTLGVSDLGDIIDGFFKN